MTDRARQRALEYLAEIIADNTLKEKKTISTDSEAQDLPDSDAKHNEVPKQ